MQQDINLLKHAIKKGEEDPFFIQMRRFIASRKNFASWKTGNAQHKFLKTTDLVSMYSEDFDISWDENDIVQAPEDEWVSAILGSEDDTINELIYDWKVSHHLVEE